jgi:hypothetical protein
VRGNKSLADDLSVRQGAVSGRVALLLRSAEAKPSLPRFVLEKPLLQFTAWLSCEAVPIGGARKEGHGYPLTHRSLAVAAG